MGELFVYILKSSLCLAAFYLFYKLMLSKETFHKFNRIVLITLFVFSFIIPFIQITLNKETPYTGVNLNIEALLAMAQLSTDTAPQETVQNPNYWIMLLFVVYVIGVAIAFLKASLSFAKMFSLIRSKDSERKNLEKNIVLVIHKKAIAPFSWMKYIVVSEIDYQESGREIISHEMAHISRKHSIDLLIAEIVKIVNWFNPAVYLLKQELQNIHEYQADEAVINKGIDAKQYQLLLIKKAVGARLYTIANSFNHSKLKNRITMISKKKSTNVAALKALFVLPLTAFALVAFASQEVTSKMEVISSTKITDFIQKDTIKKEVKTFVVKDKNQEAKVFIIKKDSVINDSKGGLIRVRISGTTTYLGDSLKYVKVDENKKPLVFIDDLEVDSDLIQILDSKKIKTVVVHKGDKAIEKYGPQAKNGVIIVTTKYNKNTKENAIENVVVRINNGGPNPLYVIDGVVQKDSLYVQSIKPETIKNISILKEELAVKTYGENARKGVIIITTKSPEEMATTPKNETIVIRGVGSISPKDKPLFVVDGVVTDDSLAQSINPESINTMYILKREAAFKKYGEKAKNGVIEITLKKEGVQVKQAGQTPKNEAQIIIRGGNDAKNQPLFVVDGVVTENNLAQSINPKSINNMYILKGDEAVKKYGEKAGNGVIEITLKKEGTSVKQAGHTQKSEAKIIVRDGNDSKSQPLYVVDGMVMGPDFKLDSINAETIQSVTVLKDSASFKQYGERGKNGVILITLKK